MFDLAEPQSLSFMTGADDSASKGSGNKPTGLAHGSSSRKKNVAIVELCLLLFKALSSSSGLGEAQETTKQCPPLVWTCRGWGTQVASGGAGWSQLDQGPWLQGHHAQILSDRAMRAGRDIRDHCSHFTDGKTKAKREFRSKY